MNFLGYLKSFEDKDYDVIQLSDSAFAFIDDESDILNIYIKENMNVSFSFGDLADQGASNVCFRLLEGSKVELFGLLEDSVPSLNLSIICEKESQIECFFLDFIDNKTKSNVDIELNGEGAKATWKLASLARLKDNKEFDVTINHNVPKTYALSENYGIAKDESRLVFTGVSDIKNGSVGASTRQVAKIVLFDEKSKAKSMPILKISENDITASHATSVGTLNENEVFYLTSRGISEEMAKNLITLGYFNPIISRFDKDEQEKINKLIKERM